MDTLTEFIQANPDARELKRALAVQMVQQDYPYRKIQAVLNVSLGFITKWKQVYEQQGVRGLRLGYQGSQGYLTTEQRQSVLEWLNVQKRWNLSELQTYLDEQYDVVFQSKQSYYTLLADAGISWKKTQKQNPKADPDAVEKKTRTDGLARATPM